MKLSYSQLIQYINKPVSPEQVSEILTSVGLEVEEVIQYESIKGGLKGFLVGEVLECAKHPDADKLSCTKVNIGSGEPLSIVCGAPNVAAGQKVIVATVGTIIYSEKGEFEIKKSKIRGEISEGMICAEDEIGIGNSHAGILVLDENAVVGMPASEIFGIHSDTIFEVNLTPNRPDAACHIGSARDIAAFLSLTDDQVGMKIPDVSAFPDVKAISEYSVGINNPELCIRYTGLHLKEVKVGESPEWLKQFLQSIGLRPINNVVDITNFVLHETGQPLHAFDAHKIKGKKVVVRTAIDGEKFETLDGNVQTLTTDDLMICNESESMCIAGVFGGANSGVSNTTTEIFLESACFQPSTVRRTSKRLGLKTDSSFRFERGTDPNATLYALKRAALLLQEICGAQIVSEIIDMYPNPPALPEIRLSWNDVKKLTGIEIESSKIEKILNRLGIDILSSDATGLHLRVPLAKTDVKRPADIVEEIIRIYGYDKIVLPGNMNYEINTAKPSDSYRYYKKIAELLSSNGYSEILTNSLSNSLYYSDVNETEKANLVHVLNPISSELDVMRMSMLYSGLEVVAYNHNRKNLDLKLYELGKIYFTQNQMDNPSKKNLENYSEEERLAVFLTGSEWVESWRNNPKDVDFYSLKSACDLIFNKLKLRKKYTLRNIELPNCEFSAEIALGGDVRVGYMAQVSSHVLRKFDIKKPVFYAELNWNTLLSVLDNKSLKFKEISKFPTIRRDLALLLDKNVNYSELENTARKVDNRILRNIDLFDVYEGKNLPDGKKSYAMSFVFADENATLTDEQVEPIMDKLIHKFQSDFGATLR